jgi:hypothetical protein
MKRRAENQLAWTLVHGITPFFEHALQRIVDKRVYGIRVGFDEIEVEDSGRVRVLLLFLALARAILVLHLTFCILDVFQGLPEIILAALTFVVAFFDELKSTQTKSPIFIFLSKQPDGLALGAESTDDFFAGDSIE